MQDSTTTSRGGVLAASARIAVTAASLAGVVAAVTSLTETDPPPGAAVAAFQLHDQTVSAAGPAEDVEAHEVLAEAAGRAQASVTARRASRERAARAARVAAAERARAAAAARAARNAVRDPRSAARALAAGRGWGAGQFSCLEALWHKESGWRHRATNPSSGAYGIPQALPGGKMSSAGADWRTNPVTQIRWGLGYIADRYGTPCGAWAHSRAHNWY